LDDIQSRREENLKVWRNRKRACPEMQMPAALNIRHEMSPYTSTQLQRHLWQKERREVFCYHTALFLFLKQTITLNHSAKWYLKTIIWKKGLF